MKGIDQFTDALTLKIDKHIYTLLFFQKTDCFLAERDRPNIAFIIHCVHNHLLILLIQFQPNHYIPVSSRIISLYPGCGLYSIIGRLSPFLNITLKPDVRPLSAFSYPNIASRYYILSNVTIF